MRNHLISLPLMLLLAMTAPLVAQETTVAEPATPEAGAAPAVAETPSPLALSMGEEEAEGPKVGDVYVDAEFLDWQLRCIKSEAPVDPCQLYQLLEDGNGNAIAEINIFPLPADQEAAAGATVVTPLETLLTQQLTMAVDAGAAKRYPFSWCSQIGCFSRIGFSDADVAAFKRGVAATLTIVPVAAPDQRVVLKVSLKGFTAGYDAAAARLAQALAQ